MSTPENSTGRERVPVSADLSPRAESEREVRRVEDEIQSTGVDRVREGMGQVEWQGGAKNGKQYQSAQVEGNWYRVYEDGQILRSEGGKYVRVPAAERGSLPGAVQQKIESMGPRWQPGERDGVRYLAARVDGRMHRLYEDGRVFRQEGRTLKLVSAEQVNTLPAAVRQKIEFLESRWQKGEENGVRYVQINLPGGQTYRINERGQVLLREQSGAFGYVSADVHLPAVVQGKLSGIEQYAQRKRAERLSGLEGEDLNRELDLEAAGKTLNELRSVRVEFAGRAEQIAGWPATGQEFFCLLSRLSVRPDRYDEYVQNVRRSADNMGRVLGEQYGPRWQGAMVWNSMLGRLESEAATGSPFAGERVVALATGALRQAAGHERRDARTGHERFWTFADAANQQAVQVLRREDVPEAARYGVYEYANAGGVTTDYHAVDGGVRFRKSPGAVQTFDDGGSTRPSTVTVLGSGAEIRCTETADPRSRIVTQQLGRGSYVLDRLGGAPVGNFRDFRAKVEAGQIRVNPGKDIREEYADYITRNLRSPQAIANFVSRFAALGSSIQRSDAVVDWQSDFGGADEQHPLVTLERGEGDCEDFALLFQYLLKKAGTNSMAVRLASNHFGSVHFEERYVERNGRMEKRYDFVLLDNVSGYINSKERIPDGFATPEEALRRVSHADMSSFAEKYRAMYGHLESRDPSSLIDAERPKVQYLREMRETQRNGGGVEVLHPPARVLAIGDPSRAQGRSGDLAYRSDFSPYVQRDNDARQRERRSVASARASRVEARPLEQSPSATPRVQERALDTPRIQSELAKMQEVQQYARNQWVTLRNGAPGYQYFMDTQGHLFASREPSNPVAGFQYLNVQNNYTWEQSNYS